jgi:hypothetical protein
MSAYKYCIQNGKIVQISKFIEHRSWHPFPTSDSTFELEVTKNGQEMLKKGETGNTMLSG